MSKPKVTLWIRLLVIACLVPVLILDIIATAQHDFDRRISGECSPKSCVASGTGKGVLIALVVGAVMLLAAAWPHAVRRFRSQWPDS